jgi:hypothetical protein
MGIMVVAAMNRKIGAIHHFPLFIFLKPTNAKEENRK